MLLEFRSIERSGSDIEVAIDRAGRWLLRNQDAEEGGWAERRGDSASSLNTAEVLLALVSVRDRLPRAGAQIRRAAEFLARQQTIEGAEAGSWPRYVSGHPRCPDLLRTSLAVEALAGANQAEPVEGVSLGEEWLRGVQNGDGGWGPRRGVGSDVLMTCFAVSALLAVAEAGETSCEEPIRQALAFLATRQAPSGSFDPEGSTSGVRTACAALALQRGERCELSVHREKRERAVTWLEENLGAAITEVELTIEIDPDRAHPQADYAFVFMTEAVVARLLAESPERRVRSGRLAREAMAAMLRGMGPDGGFFGQRVFSWSTARATYALGAARHSFDQFPEAPRGPSPQRVGRDILAFAGLALIAVVILSILGVFGPLQAIVVMFLVLALLLGYGRMTEAGFIESIKALLSGIWRRSPR